MQGEKISEFMFNTFPAGLIETNPPSLPPPKSSLFNKPFLCLEELTGLLLLESLKH